MKIGILTFHRAHNYGAVLQCYALQEILVGMGHDVEVIDYRQPFIEFLYKVRIPRRFLVKSIMKFDLYAIYEYIKFVYLPKINRQRFFRSFRNSYLNLSKQKFENDNFTENEAYVIGSDQLWSFYCTKRYEKVYWGDFNRPKDTRVIGYAISSVLDFDKFITEEKMKSNIDNFTSLSVREQNVADYILEKFKVQIPITIDPTLLTTEDMWNKLCDNGWKEKKYVAVYELRIPLGQRNFVLEKAQKYATENSLEVIDLSDMRYSVSNFISIIRYAQAVFTSSFHATVFSLIFKTPFYAFDLGDGKGNRYTDLLKAVGLEETIATENTLIECMPQMDVAYICSNLDKLRSNSLDFLQKSLS